MRETLAGLAPQGISNPRIVLLTAGPHNATYFEQAFLAQYLGYPLVEGGDLTVRDGRVFLKTLGGLHPVDVILRRLRDDYCDPLELRPDSLLGVPGLLQAARDGTIAIANAIGTGVLQTPGLIPFLPGLCRALLGEELKLPSVETWWCGDPDVREHVIENLPDMVIKPAYPLGPTDPIFAGRLDRAAADTLAASIRATPARFVAQRHAAPSTVPVIDGDALRPRPVVLRCFVVADPAGGYQAMPGALALVGGADEADISIARGRAQQGHLGHQRRRRQRVLAAARLARADRAHARRRRSAEPRGGQLLLAGALRGTGRVDRAPRADHLRAAGGAARSPIGGRFPGAAGGGAGGADDGRLGRRADRAAAAGRARGGRAGDA